MTIMVRSTSIKKILKGNKFKKKREIKIAQAMNLKEERKQKMKELLDIV